MATKKKEVIERGVGLVKRAILAAKENGTVTDPDPVAPAALRKLRLPNDEKISPAMKELLAFDASFLGWAIDEEEPELEPMSLEEFVEQEFGEDFLGPFGEAIELLGEDCIPIGEDNPRKQVLYVGNPDDKGEYAVLTLTNEDGCWIGGFVPFDVWVAQQFGILDAEEEPGSVPPGYEGCCKALAEANGDGRTGFKSEARTLERDGDDEDDEDDLDEDDLDDEGIDTDADR